MLGSTYEVSCDKEEENEATSQHSAFPPPLRAIIINKYICWSQKKLSPWRLHEIHQSNQMTSLLIKLNVEEGFYIIQVSKYLMNLGENRADDWYGIGGMGEMLKT